MDNGSRMTRECHVRFCERLRGKFLRPTHRVSRTQAADLWCCTEDGSRPPEAGLQEQASNHPVLLRSKGAVVSDRAKVIPRGVAGVY